jgi:beta-fructofuranosidase
MPCGDWTQTVCLARSDRSMRQWTRDPANPVIAGPPHGQKSIGFRDPWVFRDGVGWGMLVGTGIEDGGGALAAFRGSDLRSMSFRGFALVWSSLGSDVWTGRMWECPQLARSGNTDILVWSVWDDRVESVRAPLSELHYAVVATGAFDGDRYHIEHLERFDHGADCYAPAFLVEPDRILTWAWSWEALTPAGGAAQGWAGTLTYPREIWATPGGDIRHAPAAELRTLRGNPWQAGPIPLSDQAISSPVHSLAVEIYARIAVAGQRS